MGSVFSEGGPGRTLTGVTDSAADGAERLVVAVLWRYPEPVVPRRSAAAAIGHILAAVIDVLRRAVGRPPSPQEPTWSPPEGWTGTWSGGDGTRAVLYHRAQRRVRILDEEHVAPDDGRTLVLLVDGTSTSAAGAAPARPRIRAHALALVAQAAEVREPPAPAGRRRRAWELAQLDAHQARHARWRELVLADPVVRAFWDAPAGRDA
jgi:hypothetical protein